MSACLEHVRKCWSRSVKGSHDANVFGDSVSSPLWLALTPQVDILEARPGRVKARMKIEQRHLNGRGNVHGGMIMTLLDDITWLSLQTFGTPVVPTVSSNMSCEFVRPCGRLGDELIMVSKTVKQGRRLAFLRITFYQKGEVCAYGSQTVAVDPDMAPMTHYFTEDGSQLLPGKPPKRKAKL